jgi:hypothetical protein
MRAWRTAGVGARAVTEARARLEDRGGHTSASAQRRENFFSQMTRQRIRRGVFRSIVDLQTAINAYLAEHNASPNPSFAPNPPRPSSLLDRLPVTSLESVH